MSRYFIPLGVFVVLVVFLAVGLRMDPRKIPSPFIGKPAPSFLLPSLNEQDKLVKPKDFVGDVWILNVWASWCVSCRAEHEVLKKLAIRNEVPIIGLNYKDAPEAARQWLRQLGDPYFLSVMDRNGQAGIDWGVYGVPETFVIDKRGIVQYKHIGPVTEDAVENIILPMVRKLKSEQS